MSFLLSSSRMMISWVPLDSSLLTLIPHLYIRDIAVLRGPVKVILLAVLQSPHS
jgi:hypothetical protein